MNGKRLIQRGSNTPRRSIVLTVLLPASLCLSLFAPLARAGQASAYGFLADKSTITQTGGIAGIHRTYTITGTFQLMADFEAGTATFDQVDANAVDDSPDRHTLDPNEVFNMTSLAGVIIDRTTIRFEGTADDGSSVQITLTFADDTVALKGQTTPPPNSADMFFYDLNAVAIRKYAGGTGEPDTPYLIDTAEQMNAIGAEPNDWDKHFRLIADIDLGGYRGTAFNIIAPAGKGGRYFTGLFDGGGHTISNFTYGPTDVNSVALFGNVRGRIENVGLIDPNIDAGTRGGVAPLVDWLNKGGMSGCYVRGGNVSGNDWVGGLVAYNTGTITDCFSTAAVTGEIEAGGLTGYNDGTITGCSSAGSVTGNRFTGGLVGWNDDTISDSHSTADVTGDTTVSGLIGRNNGTIRNCSSTGRVTGVNDVAGLVGRNYGVVSSCRSGGEVSGSLYVGGLVGFHHGSITSCYSDANVQGGLQVGGLVGRHEGSIGNCYSAGSVFGDSYVGGLVGFHLGEVFNCYSAGSVTGRLKVGGLVGWRGESWVDVPPVVTACFWDTQTSGQPASAGGTGKTTAEMQTAGTFLDAGWDFVGETANGTDDIWRILEGLDYPHLSWERVLADEFKDGQPSPLWMVYEPDAKKIRVDETNGRLEVRASEAADNIDAAYISNAWRLDVTNDFRLKVNFHYGKRNAGDSWVMIALAPSLAEPISRIITFEAGCLDYQWFYLYEAIDGAWRTEETSDRSSDDGTLYVSFSADKDELYLSYTGYGKPNAWRTVTGLLKGRWGNAPVYVGLGGGSDQAGLDAGDAYLDDFVIDSGLLE